MLDRRKLAAGLGGLTLLLGTIGGAAAVHAANPASPPAASATEQPGKAEPAETAIDPSTVVKTTVDQAKAAALAKFPGGTVAKAELEDENGTVVWGVALTDASGQRQDVKVDANSGQVTSTEADTPDGAETPGASPESPGTENPND
jgi:hypothetical protein